MFVKILTDYRAERQNDPAFQPARPVIENPLLDLQRDQPDAVRLGANVITDELSRDVMEIFAAIYEVMLQVLGRYFAHTDEDDEQLLRLEERLPEPYALCALADRQGDHPASRR